MRGGTIGVAVTVLALLVAVAVIAARGDGEDPSAVPAGLARAPSSPSGSAQPIPPESDSRPSSTQPPVTRLPTTQPPATTTPSTTPPPPPPPITTPSTTLAPIRALEGRTIVVDPGHNGRNDEHPVEINRPVDAGGFTKACNTTGTAVGGVTESEVNWDIAVRLREALTEDGAEVVLTRPDDEGWGPCVDERGRTAGAVGADVLISVHADGAPASASGFHVISSPLSGAGSDALSTDVRDAMVAAGFTPADYIGGEGLDVRSDLGTLNLAPVAAAMIECGNMANANDMAILGSEDGRQRIAEALAVAVAEYLGRGQSP